MPAIGSRAAASQMRPLRLIALGLAILFLASVGAVSPAVVEARDWTPQIKATRRAQIHWESVMRSADAELRALKKSKKQAQRKLGRIKKNHRAAVDRRGSAKRRLTTARSDLGQARTELRSRVGEPPPPPVAAIALQALVSPPPVISTESVLAEPPAPPPVPRAGSVEPSVRDVKPLERAVKKAKRDFKKAKRTTKRRTRNVRAAASRVAALKAAERGAKARRAQAERNLGSWILAMNKYGRIRAAKKSDARPGVSTPFSWPVRGRISQYFHAGHDGLDIVRYKGAPIRAMAFGVVTYVGWNPWDQHGRAFMVVITHAGGYETLYGHLLPKRVVRVGEEVKKGHVIGYMGSTGNSTGPHLHLELRRGRTTINPLGFL